MERNYELLDLTYLKESFGDEIIPELLILGDTQFKEFIEGLSGIKETRKYHQQHNWYYRLKGTIAIVAAPASYDKLEIRKYVMFGYFKVASNLKELKGIHKFLNWYLQEKNSSEGEYEGRKQFQNLLTDKKNEFFLFCETLPDVGLTPIPELDAFSPEDLKDYYNYSIMNDMYNVSSDEDMKICFEKYEHLAQESLAKIISYLTKLHAEISIENQRIQASLQKTK